MQGGVGKTCLHLPSQTARNPNKSHPGGFPWFPLSMPRDELIGKKKKKRLISCNKGQVLLSTN